ncbi:MAG: hypothetical protein ACRDNS_18800, partial [Trebonia sp.]
NHALNLARADAVTVTARADQELIRAAGATPARALADAIGGGLADAVARARACAVELAGAIDLDLHIISAFDFDLTRVHELARAHESGLDPAYALARGIPREADLDLAGVFGLASVHPLDPGLALPRLLGLPLRWVADGALADAALSVLATGSPSGDPHQAFAQVLCGRAGIEEDTRLAASLDGPLVAGLRDQVARAADDWHWSVGLGRLAQACTPLDETHRLPGTAEAAATRAVALALAGVATGPGTEAPEANARGTGARETEPVNALRAVAATVTLIEERATGEAAAGESILLAVV